VVVVVVVVMKDEDDFFEGVVGLGVLVGVAQFYHI